MTNTPKSPIDPNSSAKFSTFFTGRNRSVSAPSPQNKSSGDASRDENTCIIVQTHKLSANEREEIKAFIQKPHSFNKESNPTELEPQSSISISSHNIEEAYRKFMGHSALRRFNSGSITGNNKIDNKTSNLLKKVFTRGLINLQFEYPPCALATYELQDDVSKYLELLFFRTDFSELSAQQIHDLTGKDISATCKDSDRAKKWGKIL